MRDGIARYIRAAQVRVPWLFDTKNAVQRRVRRATGRPFDADFKALATLDLRQDGLVLDIGGNRGQSIDAIRLFMPTARIISFEPNPQLANALKTMFADDPRVEVRSVALGSEPADLMLYVPYYNGWMFDGLASLDRAEAQEWLCERNLAGFRPEKIEVKSVACQVKTLDSYDEEGAVFAKIDVQGLEPQVLDGAARTLARDRPVVMLEARTDMDMLDHLPERYEPAHWDGQKLARGVSDRVNMFYLPEEVAERL